MAWIRGKLLGEGAFGSVNLALARDGGAVFAAKSVVVDAVNADVAVRALENELHLLQTLDSEFVVRCLGSDWTEENGHRMRNVFLEYMPEGCLTDFLRQFSRDGAVEEHLLRTYTRSVVEGIEYLHSHDIVHGDIKGQNILVGNGRVKLTDFGSAKHAADAGQCGQVPVSGTPLWMAPEVVQQVEQGPASDIWSLGCTVVEMATGRAPWRNLAGMNQFVALYHIGCTEDVPPVPAWLSPDAQDFLSHCFHRDPRQRWTSTQLLQHPFLTKRFTPTTLTTPITLTTSAPSSPTSVLQFSDDCDIQFSVPTLAAPPSLLKRKLVTAATPTFPDVANSNSNWCPNWCDAPASSGPWIVVRSPPGSPKSSVAFSDCRASVTHPVDSDSNGGGLQTLVEECLGGASAVNASLAVVAKSFNGGDLNPLGVESAGCELDADCVGVRLGEIRAGDGLESESCTSLGLGCGKVGISGDYLVVVNWFSNPRILVYWRHCLKRRLPRDWKICWKCGLLDYCGLLDEYKSALILEESGFSLCAIVCECVLSACCILLRWLMFICVSSHGVLWEAALVSDDALVCASS